jgi:hypothetical protein
VWAERRIF